MQLLVLCTFVCGLFSAAKGQPRWPSEVDTFDLRLRTLLVGNTGQPDDSSIISVAQVLAGFGTDYDAVAKLPDLAKPDYSSIVFARQPQPDEVETSRSYATKYGVRIVYLVGDFDTAGTAVSDGGVVGGYIVFDPSDYATQIGDTVTKSKGWQIGNILAPQPALAKDPSTKPVLRFSASSAPSSTGALAAFTTEANGPEEMYFMWDATYNALYYYPPTGRVFLKDVLSPTDQQDTYLNMAMASMWFPWVTRGIFTGQRRQHLMIQPDDWFMPSSIYNSNEIYRLHGSDCEGVIEEMDYLNSIAPEGSAFKIELPYNGFGWKLENSGPGLNECSQKNRDKFFWISHTYTHQQLDWLGPCSPAGVNCTPTPPDKVAWEVEMNVALINGSLDGSMFVDDPQGLQKYFSSISMVTPEISGLVPAGFTPPEKDVRIYGRPRNNETLTVLEQHGIRYVMGDNSRNELVSKNPFHALRTTMEGWGVANIFILPRQATVIDYNVPDPKSLLEFYVAEKACEWQVGVSCDSFNFTLPAVLRREVLGNMLDVLTYRPDPYMLHQINMKLFEYEGKQRSLLGLFAENMINATIEYLDGLPIVSLKTDNLGRFYEDRMSRDACGLVHVAHIVNGTVQGFNITSTGTCTPVLTFTRGSIVPANSTFSGSRNIKYAYGPDINLYAKVARGKAASIKINA